MHKNNEWRHFRNLIWISLGSAAVQPFKCMSLSTFSQLFVYKNIHQQLYKLDARSAISVHAYCMHRIHSALAPKTTIYSRLANVTNHFFAVQHTVSCILRTFRIVMLWLMVESVKEKGDREDLNEKNRVKKQKSMSSINHNYLKVSRSFS